MNTFRTFLCGLIVLAASIASCERNAPAIPLSVFVVSQEPIEHGRFMDTPDFPKLGYIGPKPDLTIARLEEVDSLVIAESGRSLPALAITLQPDDADEFSALTERAVMKKTLLMVGDLLLTAPAVTTPMRPSQARRLQFTCSSHAAQKEIANALGRLTR